MLNTGLLLLFLSTTHPEPVSVEGPPVQIDAQTAAKQSSLAVVNDEFHDNEPEFVQLGYDPAFLALFEENSISYTGGGYRDRVFRYRLFVPETSGPDDKRPLIVWLHGKGTSGDDNASQLRHLSTLVMTPPWERERYEFFLLAVQCPRDNPYWTPDMLAVVLVALDKTVREHPIDIDRVALVGVSSGGNGSWELALRRPELFSCVAPLASAGANESQVARLAKLSVWAFHCPADPGTPVEYVRSTVAALQSASGRAHLTETDGRDHNCWEAAFRDYELLPWLLSQKRGDADSPLAGTISAKSHFGLTWKRLAHGWTPAQLAGQIGIPLVLIIAIWSARRQKRLCRSRETSGTNEDEPQTQTGKLNLTEANNGKEGNRNTNPH